MLSGSMLSTSRPGAPCSWPAAPPRLPPALYCRMPCRRWRASESTETGRWRRPARPSLGPAVTSIRVSPKSAPTVDLAPARSGLVLAPRWARRARASADPPQPAPPGARRAAPTRSAPAQPMPRQLPTLCCRARCAPAMCASHAVHLSKDLLPRCRRNFAGRPGSAACASWPRVSRSPAPQARPLPPHLLQPGVQNQRHARRRPSCLRTISSAITPEMARSADTPPARPRSPRLWRAARHGSTAAAALLTAVTSARAQRRRLDRQVFVAARQPFPRITVRQAPAPRRVARAHLPATPLEQNHALRVYTIRYRARSGCTVPTAPRPPPSGALFDAALRMPGSAAPAGPPTSPGRPHHASPSSA